MQVVDKNKIAPTFGTVPPCDKFERDVTPKSLDETFESVFKSLCQFMQLANELKKNQIRRNELKFENGAIIKPNFKCEIIETDLTDINKRIERIKKIDPTKF